jgi:hypothetical protein
MNRTPEFEMLLLEQWREGNETALKTLINSYLQKIYALAIFLIGGDKDKAYDISVSSFVETLGGSPSIKRKDSFLVLLAGSVIKKAQGIEAASFYDVSDFSNLPAGRKEIYRITGQALAALPFTVRAFLLLRDQIRLRYRDIAHILGTSEEKARMETMHGRTHLRAKIEELIP